MKKGLLMAVVATSVLSAGAFAAKRVKDWRDLKQAHNRLIGVIHDLERARAANHYDMAGHGAKAEELCRQAEHELAEAIEAARGEK